MSSLQQELHEYRQKYATSVEALQSQQLVIDKLETMLWTKVEPELLQSDSATEVDPGVFNSTQSIFMQVAQLKIRIERMRERRRIAQERYQYYYAQLGADALLQKELSLSKSQKLTSMNSSSASPGNQSGENPRIARGGLGGGGSSVYRPTNEGIVAPSADQRVAYN